MNIKEKKERNPFWDIIRGFATIMVIWGHCIQEGNGKAFSQEALYFSDPLYKFVYSFHMPLFALLAGYFAFYSLKKVTMKDGFKKVSGVFFKKCAGYVTPIFFFTVFDFVKDVLLPIFKNPSLSLSGSLVLQFFKMFFSNVWFLWGILLSFVVVFFIHILFKDNIFVYFLSFAAMFLMPDAGILFACKFLVTFYICAYVFAMLLENAKVMALLDKIYKHKLIWLFVLLLCFLLLLTEYKDNVFIYVSGHCIFAGLWWHMGIIYIYRFFVGLVGSLFFILLFKCIYEKTKYSFPVLRRLGKYSLGIYLVQGYVIILGFRRITDQMEYSVFRPMLQTILVGIICYLITFILSKIPVIRKAVGK